MDEIDKKTIISEVKNMHKFKHPNILNFREIYKAKRGKMCIVMDYADGGNL